MIKNVSNQLKWISQFGNAALDYDKCIMISLNPQLN